uniref:phage protein n=1 Tax=Orbus wheelerorum TaxID=3074111 RepID=UPI00370D2E84
MNIVRQFGRVIQLNIGNAQQSLVYNNLKITFDVTKTISSEPNDANITIYNLNQNSRNLITSKVYDLVELFVSYRDDDLRMIFKGEIKTVENEYSGLDIITKLKCSDGGQAYTEKVLIKTVAAGQKDSDALNDSAKSFGILKSDVDLPNDKVLPRGRVFFSDVRDVMDKIGLNNDADWSIQDNQLVVVPKNKAIRNDEGYVISSNTGMIGSPQKTDQGLEVITLCNPRFKIGSLIRVESKFNEYNGDYKIQSINHSGDLTGNDWKSKLVCTGGAYEVIGEK